VATFPLPAARRFRAALLLSLLILAAVSAQAAGQKYWIFVGTYTGKGSEGIYSYRFDPDTGEISLSGLAAPTENPSFLAADPQSRFLYSVNELDALNGKPTGGVSSFQIDRTTGKLTFLQQVASLGTAPAFVSLDKSGRYVLVANYDSGNVSVFPVGQDGKFGPHSAFMQQVGSGVNPKRQAGPHAHSILTSNDNRFALSADLGTDQVLVYRFDAQKGTLAPNNPPFAQVKPGSGPRHIAFSPSGNFVYLISEMAATITLFSYDAQSGTLTTKHTVPTLPKNFKGENRGAEVAIDANGRFLYVSNRGEDSLSVYAINAADGTLSFQQRVPSGGKTPRHFAIDPTGNWLFAANRDSNNIQLFRVDRGTGRLTAASTISRISSPVCVLFVPVQ
jgi:6-phosphogluconolactonase